MNRTLCRISFILIIALFSLPQVKGQGQEAQVTGNGIKYLVYFPKNYTKSKDSFPVLLFLHGMGERGNNLEIIKRHGPPQLLDKRSWSESLPFIVISPQLPSKYDYWPVNYIDDVLNHINDVYRIDQNRIYLTGISMGAIATWNYAMKKPEKIAAIIPICGKGDAQLACRLKSLPVWAFHGDQDEIINPHGSIRLIEALNRCQGRSKKITRFTLYPGVKHDSWTRTYKNPEIYEWLLQFKNTSLDKAEDIEISEAKEVKTVPDSTFLLKEICDLPASLKESSGLQAYADDFIWTHNDSGNLPVLYQIDTTGKINNFKTITDASNFDWEDLAKDNLGNLYIGDFGNNKNTRKALQIYIIPNPNENDADRIKAKKISFTYSDQKGFPPSPDQMNFDVEAMIVYNENIYLFSKNNTQPYSGYVKLYKLPIVPGHYEAELIDSLFLGATNMFENSITAADISPDSSTIALLTYNKVWLLRNFENEKFFSGDIIPIQLPTLSQKEGITFKNNTEIYISDERFQNFIGGKLYLLDLSNFLGK